MKKIIVLLLFVLAAIGIWFYLNRNPQSSALATLAAKETNALTNLPQVVVTSPNNVASPASAAPLTNQMINAFSATNLDQWKVIIPKLKYSDNFGSFDSWVMSQTNRSYGVPVLFAKDSRSITYKANFVNISVTGGTNIMEVEMHSPIMNIDETRALGLELCNLFGIDSTKFQAWCEKVGNHWVDAPLIGVGDHSHNFNIRNTFNDEKPWYIDFVIQ